MTDRVHRMFWVLRILESILLLAMLAGIGLFAYSLIDIVRIETGAAGAPAMPPSAWPGIGAFGGGLILLQFVRLALQRYRHEDGTPRGDARDEAAAATAAVLAEAGRNEEHPDSADGDPTVETDMGA